MPGFKLAANVLRARETDLKIVEFNRNRLLGASWSQLRSRISPGRHLWKHRSSSRRPRDVKISRDQHITVYFFNQTKSTWKLYQIIRVGIDRPVDLATQTRGEITLYVQISFLYVLLAYRNLLETSQIVHSFITMH